MAPVEIIEIITLVTGLACLTAQVLHDQRMWFFNILTAAGAVYVTASAHIWAQVLLNTYFLVMSIIGILSWQKIRRNAEDENIQIVKISRKTATLSSIIFLTVTPFLCFLLYRTNDPSPILDGLSFTLSILATWWLTRSHIEQWYLWIAADLVTAILFLIQENWWMFVLYVAYIVSAFVGIRYWNKNGTLTSEAKALK